LRDVPGGETIDLCEARHVDDRDALRATSRFIAATCAPTVCDGMTPGRQSPCASGYISSGAEGSAAYGTGSFCRTARICHQPR
jgi:hypothetical protein